jgi:hypothetical protein
MLRRYGLDNDTARHGTDQRERERESQASSVSL